MRDDRKIDRRQHGLPRTVVDRIATEQDLLAALRDDAQAQVVDAVEWCAWRIAPMQRQRRNGGVVVAVGLGKAPDGASEVAHSASVPSAVPAHCQFDASAVSPAASHHHRTGLDARHATNRFASVSSVSGTVVTNAQNLRPVSSRRALFDTGADGDEYVHGPGGRGSGAPDPQAEKVARASVVTCKSGASSRLTVASGIAARAAVC
jgi:hypothetical protein